MSTPNQGEPQEPGIITPVDPALLGNPTGETVPEGAKVYDGTPLSHALGEEDGHERVVGEAPENAAYLMSQRTGGGNQTPPTTPPAERGQAPQPNSSHKLRNRLIVGGTVLAVGAGGVVAGVELAGGSSKGKPAAISSVGPTGHPSNTPNTAPSTATQPTPTDTNLPSSVTTSPNTAPSTGDTPITINGNEFSAGTLDPKTPVAVPWIKGQDPTVAGVEKLLHNVDVAITTDNLNTLLYSGVYPDSQIADSLQPIISGYDTERNSATALIHSFQSRLYDKDIQFDPADPMHVQAYVAMGSDFDFVSAPNRVRYYLYDIRLDHATTTLPNGQSEDILTLAQINASDSTNEAWYHGFTG